MEDSDDNSRQTPNSQSIDMDIIELNSDDDDEEHTNDLDNETKLQIKSLIESDDEAELMPSETKSEPRKTLLMLMHFMCPECDFNCGSEKKWVLHTESEHGFGQISKINMRTIVNKHGHLCYQCNDCLQKYSFKNSYTKLLQHRILKHMTFSAYLKCRLCSKRFKEKNKITFHLKTEHKKICKYYLHHKRTVTHLYEYFCPLCNEFQKTRDTWSSHLEESHDDFINKLKKEAVFVTDDVVECKEENCKRRFLFQNIVSHFISMHSQYETYKCKKCDFRTHSSNSIRYHIHSKHSSNLSLKRTYNCRYCESRFTKFLDLKCHLKVVHKLQKLKCDQCKKKFNTGAALLHHMKISNHLKIK